MARIGAVVGAGTGVGTVERTVTPMSTFAAFVTAGDKEIATANGRIVASALRRAASLEAMVPDVRVAGATARA